VVAVSSSDVHTRPKQLCRRHQCIAAEERLLIFCDVPAQQQFCLRSVCNRELQVLFDRYQRGLVRCYVENQLASVQVFISLSIAFRLR
jgi:hypothetical protein